MCKVQVKAKRERQNDDYATADTNPNSSSLNDNAHRVRRRLSQTITSRSCLLIAIALALPSAHACDDTVELQVTCDSSVTPWVVKSSEAIDDDTTVTVGSCIDGHVKYVAQVKGKDINDNGIVLCAQQSVCYHLNRPSGKIEAKNCDGYGDPICNYICHDGSITHKKGTGDSNLDGTAREPINDNIICDNSTNNAYIYECNGNIIVRKTHCPNGCADDHQGCKQDSDLTDKCTKKDTLICEGEALFDCRNSKYIEGGKACNDKGEVVSCQENKLKQEMHTCADDKVVWCKKDKSGKQELHTSECYPNNDKNTNKYVCKSKQSTNTCTRCSGEGNCIASGTDANQKVSCKEDLTGITPSTGTTGTECQYCYNKDVNNTPVSIGELVCEGCEPNKYKRKDSADSSLNLNDEVCYNGKFEQFGNAEGGNFLHVPKSNSNELWEFALNVTVALPDGLSPNPPANQFQTLPQRTWRYYNCHNDDAMKFISQDSNVNNADDFLKLLKNSNKCCDDENSYYITQTGYRYYSVEKCTNIALDNTSNGTSRATNFSAYAYTPELNGSIIGIEDDLLAKDYACLKSKDSSDEGGEASVRRMMFIKQKTNGEQQSKDGEPKHGIYKAFECPENYECDLKNPYNGLCIFKKETIVETIEGCGDFKCNEDVNTISCGNETIAACPKGTTPHIVGDNSKCDVLSSFTLDQIRCVPDGKFTAK